jgi:hypothetical protein
MTAYADLASLPEDKRIAIIARVVSTEKKTVAVAIDNEEKKISRYERKLHECAPGPLEIERLPGLGPSTIFLKIKPKIQNVPNN